MSKGNQKRYGIRRKPPAGTPTWPKQGVVRDSDFMPKKKQNVLTIDEIEREIREKKRRKRGPRVRGRKAPA